MRLGVGAALVGGELVRGDVSVHDGRIAAVGVGAAAGERIAVPGFVDLQVNGFAGVDLLVASRDDYDAAGAALAACGVTAYQPTFITAGENALRDALRAMPESASGPQIMGAHLEGPFISPERLGTHPGEHRRDPDLALLDRLLGYGRVAHVTLAPELPGAHALIAALRARGVVVAAGHSEATAAEANAAFDAGVTTVTHVFNAMRPLGAREPGVAGAALARPDVTVQLIADGHHVADETVRLVWACARGRVALVSDATAAAAAPAGAYRLGEVEIVAASDSPPRRADGVLAGTALTMIDAVRHLHALGAGLPDAVAAASAVPARIAGRDDLGILEPGARADVVVLDDRLEISAVLCEGAPVGLA
jgi:N-acetylglucosamine-6-phosphate deacetylase